MLEPKNRSNSCYKSWNWVLKQKQQHETQFIRLDFQIEVHNEWGRDDHQYGMILCRWPRHKNTWCTQFANALALSDTRCTFSFSKSNLLKVSQGPDFLHYCLEVIPGLHSSSPGDMGDGLPSKDEMTNQGNKGHNHMLSSPSSASTPWYPGDCIIFNLIDGDQAGHLISSILMMVTKLAILCNAVLWI